MIDVYKDLEELGLMVRQQGNVPEVKPDKYLTVWNGFSGDNMNADNLTVSIEYNFTIILYTTDWDNVHSDMEEVISLLKSKNYVIDGNGFDIDSGDDSYMAKCIEARIIERRI